MIKDDFRIPIEPPGFPMGNSYLRPFGQIFRGENFVRPRCLVHDDFFLDVRFSTNPTPLKFNMEALQKVPGKGNSFWKAPFSGSILNFGGVVCLDDLSVSLLTQR